jgi:diaminopimelate decarboxylase/aspartate kinase
MLQREPWIVLKFGGTSVSTENNWTKIADIVRRRAEEGYRVCVVHSALKGISDKLQVLAETTDEDQSRTIIKEIKFRHARLAASLGLDEEAILSTYYQELQNISEGVVLIGEVSTKVVARLLALGELMATALGHAYLRKNSIELQWLDARNFLQSIPEKNVSGERAVLHAVCEAEADEELQQRFGNAGPVIITQGFIARDENQQTVLLGRGGSDVSAAYFAAKLQAERLEIWTDVPGLFTANPNRVPSARLLNQLSYEEAQEIATNGAHVLHPRCIHPAQKQEIPIHVRCTPRPDLEGTVISNEYSGDDGLVKTVAVRPNITLVSMESLGMWQQVGFLADAFEVFKQFELSIDLISTSESNVTVSLDHSYNTHFNQIRAEFKRALSKYCTVYVIDSVSAVSLVGRHIRTILHRLGKSFEVFKEHQVYLVSQAANDLNFTFVVAADQAERLVRQLHEQVITKMRDVPAMGGTWSELMEARDGEQEPVTYWWQKRRDELLEIAEEQGSSYVYDRDELQQNVERIRKIDAADRHFYAMKANANTEVLSHFYDSGLGFECVSIGEVERVLELFPDINRNRILFTPNFAARVEYEQGFDYGIHLTLDNIFPLQKWPDVFRNQAFFLRIDPGHGKGHHKHVKTGGVHSKFGIPQFEIEQVKTITQQIDATITGLHAHTGSGIKDENLWKETAITLHRVAEQLGGVEILDLGGGFGIQENESQAALDLKAVNDLLNKFKNTYDYKIWVEPGRFLTATAGVLVTTLTQLKGKGKVKYVGVETGMNSFIRPALYGASHTIVNLSKLDEPNTQNVNIVGPICESGDKLGIDRRFPESEEGDVILIANTGAYGRVMSSNYNLREPAGEVVI